MNKHATRLKEKSQQRTRKTSHERTVIIDPSIESIIFLKRTKMTGNKVFVTKGRRLATI
jgi:hypothetical protein